ncbi:Patatin-like phospholipase [Enhygromyxa salina]|uniref:Patatin-like phospholipase n=1 Tax=Enhygromyxa salina TaxID=215803 RepID=A0A2S9XQ93_9BACT|nr:patatin-like phospholipase family protein [Enhygromyxa salina]PRP95026.1 Patatin-like phospholipase [Enhygromyxa salina]
MKLAIVVEGGGLRGSFAVGALAELAQVLPVAPAHVFATSSGAPNAAYFTTGQIEDGVRIWALRTHGSQLVDYRNLVGPASVMKIDELVSVFRDEIPLDVAELGGSRTQLHITVTEVESGEARVIRATEHNVFDLLTAAMALPFAYGKVVTVDDGRYIDGGFRAPVAIREAIALEPDKIIVMLTKPRGHRRKARALSEWLQCRSYPEFPHTQAAIRAKWMQYNATMELLDELEGSGRIMTVRPPGELPTGRLSRSERRILASIELGRATVRAQTRELNAYLGC